MTQPFYPFIRSFIFIYNSERTDEKQHYSTQKTAGCVGSRSLRVFYVAATVSGRDSTCRLFIHFTHLENLVHINVNLLIVGSIGIENDVNAEGTSLVNVNEPILGGP